MFTIQDVLQDEPRGKEIVDRLGKLPSKEQQLSRTQHFILKAHAAIFVLHIQYGPRGTPLTPMIQRQNCLLSTSSLSKKTINILICFEKWKKQNKTKRT